MCNYCRKITPAAHDLREGQDVNIGYEGEAFVDFFNNLVVHLEGENSVEVNIPIAYCPWCGNKLESYKGGNKAK